MSDLKQEVATIQERINGILTDNEKIIGKRKHLQKGDKIPERWNHFDLDQQRKVTALGAEYSGILANAVDDISTTPKDLKNYKDEKFLAKVKELVPLLFEVTKRVTEHLNQITEYDPALVKYAFNVFVNNHPATIFLDLKTPSLKRLSSVLLLPGRPLPLNGPESKMDWYREDPAISEHHHHWHSIFVTNGIPDPKFPNPNFAYTKDRQGELFVWMHKQMLARYDAERVAVGLDPVIQLNNYKNSIPEGYLPSEYLLNYNEKSDLKDLEDKYDYRLPNSQMAPEDIKTMEGWVAAINKSIDDGVFYNAPDRLGRTIDPDRVNPDIFEDNEWKDKYGKFHGTGHVYIANMVGNKQLIGALKNNPDIGKAVPKGLIGNVSIAPKDPAFYRWHRFVDETFNRAFESHGPRIFADAPNVVIKSCDLRFVFKDELVKVCPTGEKDRWQQYAETSYAQIPYTDVLQTKMVPRNLKTPDGSIQIEHLFPREFYYIFKITNKTTRDGYNPSTKKLEPVATEKLVTLRVFIVPEVLAHDRKQWIEMDKFKVKLNKSGETIISRAAELSSVIRKPAQKVFDDTPGDDFDNDYCGCGWPYHLLLPRGTREGMKFKLFVFISDWNVDKVPESTEEGSLSMCGRKIVNERPAIYPDARDMGYPFDRPYAGHSLKATFSKALIADTKPADEKAAAAKIADAKAAAGDWPKATSDLPEDDWIDNATIRDFKIQWVDKFDCE